MRAISAEAAFAAPCPAPIKYTVINIGGNKYRIVLEEFYESSLVLIRFVLTHDEYDRNHWRKDADTHDSNAGNPRKPRKAAKKIPEKGGKKRRGNQDS